MGVMLLLLAQVAAATQPALAAPDLMDLCGLVGRVRARKLVFLS
jgi:hypothetical protein